MKKFKCVKVLSCILIATTLVLGGCSQKQSDVDKKIETSESNQELNENEEVDKEVGLVHEKQLELKYAKSFSVDYYKGNYKLITDWNGRKTLIVPEGKDAPEDLNKDILVLKQPINTVGMFSSTNVAMLRPLNLLDKVVMTTTEQDKWYVDEVVEGMKEGKIIYVGKNSAPDYELIEQAKPDITFITSGTAHGNDDVTLKFDEIGVKWLSYGGQRESDPRARMEWVKLAGVLFNLEDEAEKFFDGELEKFAEIEKLTNNIKEEDRQTFVSTFISSSADIFYARNAGDYEVKLFELAGGKYLLGDLNKDKDGSTKMTPEEFYQQVENADVFFYNNLTGPTVQSQADLIERAEYMKDVKGIKEGNVWGFKDHYNQSMDKSADILKDLYTIFTTPKGEITETDFFFIME